MPGFLLHVGAMEQCPHQIPINPVSGNTRVFVSGQPVVTLSDTFPIAGCPFFVGTKPQPCVRVQWTSAATRVLVNGQPPLLQTSMGLCMSRTRSQTARPPSRRLRRE